MNYLSSFRTNGIWVMLRYLSLPIVVAACTYVLGGASTRASIDARVLSSLVPIQEEISVFFGNSDTSLANDASLENTDKSNLSDVVAPNETLADVPVGAISDVIRAPDGSNTNALSQLPDPTCPDKDSIVFHKPKTTANRLPR